MTFYASMENTLRRSRIERRFWLNYSDFDGSIGWTNQTWANSERSNPTIDDRSSIYVKRSRENRNMWFLYVQTLPRSDDVSSKFSIITLYCTDEVATNPIYWTTFFFYIQRDSRHLYDLMVINRLSNVGLQIIDFACFRLFEQSVWRICINRSESTRWLSKYAGHTRSSIASVLQPRNSHEILWVPSLCRFRFTETTKPTIVFFFLFSHTILAKESRGDVDHAWMGQRRRKIAREIDIGIVYVE